MVICEDIDKKNNKECKSAAKWIVKINGKKNYRCGRHCRKLEKIPMDNDNKIKDYEKNEINFGIKDKRNIQQISYLESSDNRNEKMKILFTKIDELCILLNKKI
jgi:hypothetical protein